jgi:hypothetical protein
LCLLIAALALQALYATAVLGCCTTEMLANSLCGAVVAVRSCCRHLQRNPDNQLYPLFEYFENWCQDENRHGDFFTAILKVRGGSRRHAPSL